MIGSIAVENGCGATLTFVSLAVGIRRKRLRPLPVTEPSTNPPATELLVSATNPDGWRLDELIAQIRGELEKQLLALDGTKETVRPRLVGYHGVVAALWEAEGRYRVLGPHQSSP